MVKISILIHTIISIALIVEHWTNPAKPLNCNFQPINYVTVIMKIDMKDYLKNSLLKKKFSNNRNFKVVKLLIQKRT